MSTEIIDRNTAPYVTGPAGDMVMLPQPEELTFGDVRHLIGRTRVLRQRTTLLGDMYLQVRIDFEAESIEITRVSFSEEAQSQAARVAIKHAWLMLDQYGVDDVEIALHDAVNIRSSLLRRLSLEEFTVNEA